MLKQPQSENHWRFNAWTQVRFPICLSIGLAR